jgi:hypothetical protein
VVASDRTGFEPEHGSITILQILKNFLLSETKSHLQKDCSENLQHAYTFISNVFRTVVVQNSKPLNHEYDGFSAY